MVSRYNGREVGQMFWLNLFVIGIGKIHQNRVQGNVSMAWREQELVNISPMINPGIRWPQDVPSAGNTASLDAAGQTNVMFTSYLIRTSKA